MKEGVWRAGAIGSKRTIDVQFFFAPSSVLPQSRTVTMVLTSLLCWRHLSLVSIFHLSTTKVKRTGTNELSKSNNSAITLAMALTLFQVAISLFGFLSFRSVRLLVLWELVLSGESRLIK